MRVVGALLVIAAVVAAASTAHGATDSRDAYLAGYVTAVLEREFQARASSLRVERGVVSISAADLGAADRAQVTAALARIPGVVRVEISEGAPPTPVAVGSRAKQEGDKQAQVLEDLTIGFLPGGELFRPLIADPRWPHFAASYQHYLDDRQLGNVGAVSFGETFTLFRDRLGRGWWETGIQAGVFAVFDLDAQSIDLVNADYLAAIFLGYRLGKVSAIGRLFHQSSHLGDEFLLGNRVRNRVNLSYEAVDLRLSYDLLGDAVRIYGGGGYLFDQEPVDLAPGFVQWGLELRGPRLGPSGVFRPIAAADVQHREENSWDVDLSLRVGIEFEGWLATRNLQILLEYFRGHSPNGQFYRDRIDYLGLGAHFNF